MWRLAEDMLHASRFFFVIPAKAGIQLGRAVLDPGLRRDDDAGECA
jgi:hypothetical protein